MRKRGSALLPSIGLIVVIIGILTLMFLATHNKIVVQRQPTLKETKTVTQVNGFIKIGDNWLIKKENIINIYFTTRNTLSITVGTTGGHSTFRDNVSQETYSKLIRILDK